MQDELIILVDEQDTEIGVMPKLEVHEKGLLHRAFSIFIFNSAGELLLQQRAASKYHSGGLWSNTCCSHPIAGETLEDATKRRLQQEVGLHVAMQPMFSFLYKATFGNGLTEHELDHVFIGVSDKSPKLNNHEASDYTYISLENLKKNMFAHPERYTVWLQICLPNVIEWIKSNPSFLDKKITPNE